MSDELGLINYDSGEGDEVFLGKEIGQQRPYGENTQTVIDQEVKKIVNKCYKDAKAMIEEHNRCPSQMCRIIIRERTH